MVAPHLKSNLELLPTGQNSNNKFYRRIEAIMFLIYSVLLDDEEIPLEDGAYLPEIVTALGSCELQFAKLKKAFLNIVSYSARFIPK